MIDSISLVGFLVLGIIGWITYKIYIWPNYISPLRKIPGPPSENPFFGNIKTFMKEESGEPQLRWIKKYGNIIKVHGIFNEPIVFVADPKIIQDISVTRAYDFIKPPGLLADSIAVAGRGLIYAEGDDHKRQRKMINPAFTHSKIKEMVPRSIPIVMTLKGLIEDKINRGESNINLTPYISEATLDIIGLVGFNCEFNSLKSPNELAEAYDSLMCSPVNAINIISNYAPFVRKLPLEVNKKFRKECSIIDRESKKLVEERCKEAENGELKKNDLLSIIINTNRTLPIEEKISKEELKYQIKTFLVAGHESTSVSICWALYYLSQNLHEQDLLREELVKAFPDKSKFNPTFDEINSLEYLNCVIKETLRLASPATSARRTNTKDEVFGDYYIPKDTIIMMAISVLHRLPEIWGSTADNFVPKRWLDPSLAKNTSNLIYLPFLNGPRSCIGNKLALTKIKILLCMLIRNFVFKPIEGFHIRKRIIPVTKPDPYLGLDVSVVES
ncbi:cytochrome P450 [Rhizophagus irregularis]|uniref:Cytochrome P450 n=1 Tax=Rhizophagus irregularis TaxID=588596 RepID=A0A2N0Q2X8_9GLOM|nr:cytochrome P450 [Rhizophagus irregularis]